MLNNKIFKKVAFADCPPSYREGGTGVRLLNLKAQPSLLRQIVQIAQIVQKTQKTQKTIEILKKNL
mgnify:CR=1 FL=1